MCGVYSISSEIVLRVVAAVKHVSEGEGGRGGVCAEEWTCAKMDYLFD